MVAYSMYASYAEAVLAGGGLPVLIPLSPAEADLAALLARLDGLLLAGGGDVDPACYGAAAHPKTALVDNRRDHVEIALVRAAMATNKPVLGICRGAQVFNVALEGTLYQHLPEEYSSTLNHSCIPPDYPRSHLAHAVQVEAGSLLAECLGEASTLVNSRHHQAVRELAAGLVVTGRAPDGLVEAVELPGHPFALGVQWHPENLLAQPAMRALFTRFAAASAPHE